MSTTDKLTQIISSWAQKLHFPVKVYLFGSQARDTEKPESDLDIAVEPLLPNLDTMSRLNKVYDIEHSLRDLLHEATGLSIHVVFYDGNPHTRKGHDIITEGHLLYSPKEHGNH